MFKIKILSMLAVGLLGYYGYTQLSGKQQPQPSTAQVQSVTNESLGDDTGASPANDTQNAPETDVLSQFAARQSVSTRSTASVSEQSAPLRDWTPQNRFLSEVFALNEIESSTFTYGTGTNLADETVDINMMVVKPKSANDSETQRPLIIILSGGDEGGAYCDSTYEDEETELATQAAQHGYVAMNLEPIMYPSLFCPWQATGEDYQANMQNNIDALYKAIEYAKTNHASLGINPDKITLYGYSIGGTTSLLTSRGSFATGETVAAIVGYAAFSPGSFGSYYQPPVADNILMVSYETDTGFVGVTADAQADCAAFTVNGYPCEFGYVPGANHPVHPTLNLDVVTTNGTTTVYNIFYDFLYDNVVGLPGN